MNHGQGSPGILFMRSLFEAFPTVFDKEDLREIRMELRVLVDGENTSWPKSCKDFSVPFKQACNIHHRSICTHLKISASKRGL